MKFKYVATDYSMTTVSGGNWQTLQIFRGNSLYDPDYTGTGVQPYGYDNWCSSSAFYSKYMVVASKIKIYLSTTANQANCPKIMVFIIPSEDTSQTNHDVDNLLMVPRVKSRSMGIGDYKTGSQLKLSHYASTKKILGKAKGGDGSCTASYDSNPGNVWYWQVYVDTSSWAYEAPILMDVKITYYSILSDPNSQGPS